MAKRTKNGVGWREDRTRKFQILVSADFTCAYCGDRPGADLLHVDHLVPVSKGGSDNDENLCCACKTCNTRKSDSIIFPPSMVIGINEDGFRIHRKFGDWAIMFNADMIVMERVGWGYWFEVEQLYEDRFERHLYEKGWDRPDWLDFCECAYYAKRLVADTSSTNA